MKVHGKNVLKELLRSGEEIIKVYMSKNFNDEEIITEIAKKKIETKIVDNFWLDKVANKAHQGIVAEIKDFEYCDVDNLVFETNKKYPLIVMLDHLEDPHNLGAIIRTCEAAGVDGIIIPKDRSVEVNSTVMKVSAGALPYVKIALVTNLVSTLKMLKKQGYFVVGTDGEGTSYHDIDYKMKTVLVIGSEGNGMSRLVKEECDFIASLPMNGQVNSLNASVAAGIMIYEIIKNEL